MSKQPLIEQLDKAIERILANPDDAVPSTDPEVASLLPIAHDLRDLPNAEFKANLKADLERMAMATAKTTVNIAALRLGFRTITPYLLPPGPEFDKFLKDVFGAEQTAWHEAGPGRVHAEYRIGDSMLMVGIGSGTKMPAVLTVYVDDVDTTYHRALAAGATSAYNVTESYGDRFGVVQDAADNFWIISKYLGRDPILAQPQLNTITLGFSVEGAARFIDFLKQAFVAEEVVRYDAEGQVKHAKIRIGDSIIGVGDAHGPQSCRSMIRMYVPNCDATYEQALRSGGKSIAPVNDRPYGDREGGVEDAWGNQWFMATPIK